MKESKDLLVKLSKLPCSVVIVGLKSNNEKMIELDGDDYALQDQKGVEVERDIVQFVSLEEAKQDQNL